MTEPLPPETLAWLRQTANCNQLDAQLTLHILERLEVLEKKYQTQRLATLEWGKDVDKLMRWIDDHLKRIMALEQRPILGSVDLAAPTPEAAPVATDEELWSFWADRPLMPLSAAAALRAIYELGRQHGSAQPAPQPAQPAPMQRLIDAPMDARGYADLREPATPAASVGGLVERVAQSLSAASGLPSGNWDHCADAAIREVAEWLDRWGQHGCSLLLRQEADR